MTSPAPAPPLRLGSTAERPAITVHGHPVTYRELSTLIAQQRRRIRLNDDPVPATGLPVVECLVAVFAAASAGRTVVIGDPTGTVPAVTGVPEGTFLVAVTSGTSGTPRPVMRTAASWTRSFAPFSRLTGITSEDRVLLTGPLHATLHLFAAVHTLSVGGEITDSANEATAAHAVPAALHGVLAALPDDAPLRRVVVAGSALPDRLAREALERDLSLCEYYGAAELSFVAARRHPAPLRPFPGAEVQLRDGVVWVRSPYLSSGYAGNCRGPLRWDDEGFATVGDLAGERPDGGLLIRGRGDSAVTTGGVTVLVEDVERVLAGLPQVDSVVVVGVPHATLGAVLTAVVQPRSGSDLTGLRAAARAVLHGPALPRRWMISDRLPTTPSGKVARYPVAVAAERCAGGGTADTASEGATVLRPLP